MSEHTLTTSSAVLDAFIERSWRSNAERQRAKGAEFVIGKREGIYMWDLEGDHRVIDCGTAGGVHSLGHRHPEILAALRGALDDGRDTGLWSVPNLEYLKVQDRLTRLSPSPELNRSLFTLCSTLSVDAATMFSMRYTGRQKMVAYRHGYHGHTGFAAQLTGSLEEGIIDHYNLPDSLTKFFDNYGDLDELDRLLTDDVAALIMEPMNYESFAPATQEFMDAVTKMCNARGVLFIIDETRTGLGRTGKLWASEHFNLRPDMLVTGKGLSGGLYPASALLMKQAIYEKCMNEHKFSYISSLGGNEISCIVADKVLEVSSRAEVLQHVNEVSSYFREQLQAICDERQDLYTDATSFGCILSMGIRDPDLARAIYANLYFNGILCHSICELEVSSMKFLPPLVITREDIDEIIDALKLSIQQAL
jgi:acetylornithine aminotransferase